MNRIASIFIALLLASTSALGQIRNAVRITHSLQPASGHRVGDVVQLRLQVSIQDGYHIYSSIPPEGAGNLPTTFKLDPETKGLELVGKLQEEGQRKKKYDEVFETNVQYFEHSVVFIQSIRITAQQATLAGYLGYQVCDSSSCIPGSYNIKLNLTALAAATQQTEKKTEENTPAAKPDLATADTQRTTATEKPATTTAPETAKPTTNLALIFVEAFLFGLVGLLTPCVFPMIPLTVSYFTKRSPTRAAGVRNAFLYAGSIVFIFTVVGLLITIIFGSAALYNLASSPWLNLLFFVIVVAFGLSFLGLFNIELPSSWMTAVDKQADKGGLLGIFFMALTLVLVSFSCTGPLVGTLLVNAASGSYMGPALGMLGFSLAFAIPFGLFALFPSWLNALPKSGGWLNTIKVVLGFLELALALKFLSNADLVWHLGILDREVYLAAWIVIFALLGFYLLGKLRLKYDSVMERIPLGNLMAALLVFWFTIYLIPGLWGAPLKLLSGFLPPVNEDIGVKFAGYANNQQATQDIAQGICSIQDRKYAENLKRSTPPGFCVFYDLEQGLAYAKQVNKPVFLDFTGHTCVNCRQMESNVWSDPRVGNKLRDGYVIISLFVDDQTPLDKAIDLPDGTRLRTIGDRWLDHQQRAYNTNAQPYYVLLGHDGKALVPARAYDLNKEAYLKFLDSGIAAFAQVGKAAASK